MTQVALRGSTQIKDGTLPLSKLVDGYQIPTANLQEGSTFLRYDGSVLPIADLSLNNHRLVTVADPVDPQDAVNYRTVMSLVNGVTVRSVRAVVNTNVTLSGVQNPPGITGAIGDEVLLTAQSTTSQNGPWLMAASAWTRPLWWSPGSTQKATIVLVREGTWGDTKFMCITDGNIVVDTSTTSWIPDNSGSTYTNGQGLSLTSGEFAVKTGQGIDFDGGQNLQVALDGASLSRSGSGIKITNGTAGYILQANAVGIATWTAVSGDITLSNTGVATISTNPATGFLKYINFVMNEVPNGLINGSNVTFSLVSAPIAGCLALYFNGQRLRSGAGNDYTLSGTTITMLFIPESGDVLIADYLK